MGSFMMMIKSRDNKSSWESKTKRVRSGCEETLMVISNTIDYHAHFIEMV